MNKAADAVRIATVNLSGAVMHLYRQTGAPDNQVRDYFGISPYKRGPKDPPMFCAHSSIKGAILEFSHTARVRVDFLCNTQGARDE